MHEAERFYSARFYSVTPAGGRVSHRIERLSAVVAALVAAMLLGGPSSDDAIEFGVARLPPSSDGSARGPIPANALASAPCVERDGACRGTRAAPSLAPLPVRGSPFSGR